jgi:Na+/melibiose symporter-like transporter
MPILIKAALMWLVLLGAMMGNGFLRVLVLQPRLGEDSARQVACVTGTLLILALTAPFVGSLHQARQGQLLSIGMLWLLMTIAFEFGFGRLSGASWEALLADYDVRQGRLWPLVLLTTFLAPWLVARARR